MVLNTDMLSQLRQSQVDAGFTTTVVAYRRTSGTYDAGTSITAEIGQDTTREDTGDHADGSRKIKVRTIHVRPMQAFTGFKLGDKVVYSATTFICMEFAGTDIIRWVCEHRTSLGGSKDGGFRAEGG